MQPTSLSTSNAPPSELAPCLCRSTVMRLPKDRDVTDEDESEQQAALETAYSIYLAGLQHWSSQRAATCDLWYDPIKTTASILEHTSRYKDETERLRVENFALKRQLDEMLGKEVNEEDTQAVVALERALMSADTEWVTDFDGVVRERLEENMFGGEKALRVLNGPEHGRARFSLCSLLGI